MKIPKIDSHQHFWQYDAAKHVWMNDEMNALKTDYFPSDLKPHLQKYDLDGCIAVQANQAEVENEFLLSLSNKHDIIKGIVGWVDLRADNVLERLEYYQQFPKMKGFRHVIHDEFELDFMLQSDFMEGVSLLKNYDFTYDILIFEKHLPNTLIFIKNLPNQPFVIDHIAKPNIKLGNIDTWKNQLMDFSYFENVYCKISGMVTEADWQNWQKKDFTKYLDVVIEAFGTNRIMYGSDWPVCTLSASYEQQFNIVKDYFSSFSISEQEQFFGGNASKFYQL